MKRERQSDAQGYDILRCTVCGQDNRIPDPATKGMYYCGRCKQVVLAAKAATRDRRPGAAPSTERVEHGCSPAPDEPKEVPSKPLLIMIESDGPPLASQEEVDELLKQAFPNLQELIRYYGGVRIRTFGSSPVKPEGQWEEAERIAQSYEGYDMMKIIASVMVHAPEYDAQKAEYIEGKHPKTGVMCRIAVCRP